MIKVYTDGSSKPTNPGPSGLGVLLVKDNLIIECRSEFLGHGTNNIAELMAISVALNILKQKNFSWEPSIILTDSKYAIGVLVEGWKAKKNIDLIKKIKNQMEDFPNTELKWVKGHSGDRYNDIVDKLAKEVIDINNEFL